MYSYMHVGQSANAQRYRSCCAKRSLLPSSVFYSSHVPVLRQDIRSQNMNEEVERQGRPKRSFFFVTRTLKLSIKAQIIGLDLVTYVYNSCVSVRHAFQFTSTIR